MGPVTGNVGAGYNELRRSFPFKGKAGMGMGRRPATSYLDSLTHPQRYSSEPVHWTHPHPCPVRIAVHWTHPHGLSTIAVH